MTSSHESTSERSVRVLIQTSHELPCIVSTQAHTVKLCCSSHLCEEHRQQCRGRLLLSRYYEEKGFAVILVSRILNLLALAFTIAFSAFLLLSVKWGALHSECILRDTCDISEVRPHTPKPLTNTPVLLGPRVLDTRFCIASAACKLTPLMLSSLCRWRLRDIR